MGKYIQIEKDVVCSTPCEVDVSVRKYVENSHKEYDDEAILNEKNRQIYSQLSSLRKSVIAWYDFNKDARVLHVNCGNGVFIGALCDRVKHVTAYEENLYRARTCDIRYSRRQNLTIIAGDWNHDESDEKFDYIVVGEEFAETCSKGNAKENYVKQLKSLLRFMNNQTKVIMLFHNRFGLQYICGDTDPVTSKIFGTLNCANSDLSRISFSKKEIHNLLSEAGYRKVKYYYPVSNHRYPNMIFSDEIMPDKNIKERLLTYYNSQDTLLLNERELYEDIIENGVFDFFSNSYFVECSVNASACEIQYAAISADRALSKKSITVIYQDRVEKKGIYLEDDQNIINLYNNMKVLEQRDIPVIPSKLVGSILVMPKIESPKLSDYLKKIVKDSKQIFLDLYDLLWNDIMKSSDCVSECDRNFRMKADSFGVVDYGPILKQAFIEMIPLNCFYVENKLVYFDQEFVWNNYPAKYILFRAIACTYAFSPEIQVYVPREELYSKYGLLHLVDLFQEIENEFYRSIRQPLLYKPMSEWSKVDASRVEQNIELISKQLNTDFTNEQPNYDSKMMSIRNIELQILDCFKTLCDENKLSFYLVYGTLLGAVRHKGFIPWDDDIDVAMPRSDYDQFIKIAKESLPAPYFLQTMENDSECFYNGYCRIRDENTTGISVQDIGHNGHLGIWMDIFPIDHYPMTPKVARRQQKKIAKYQRILFAQTYGRDYKTYQGFSEWRWKIYVEYSKLLKRKDLCTKLNREYKKYNLEETDYYAILTHTYPKILEKGIFESSILLEFENRMLPAPVGYRRFLEMSSGIDYMKLPPKNKQIPHHEGIFDATKSYVEFNKHLINIWNVSKHKKLIIFGAGLMFDHYMTHYSKRFPPSFIVDNDERKWGTKRQEVVIKSPEELLKIPIDNRHIIICSAAYKQIEKQLSDMGIQDYYIYIQNKEWVVDKK